MSLDSEFPIRRHRLAHPHKRSYDDDVDLFEITIRDFEYAPSSTVNRNMKSLGKRSAFLFTARLSAPVVTP